MRTTGKKRASTSVAYLERVNRAIDHILTHLAEPLNLAALSEVALLSPCHFHRVFQAIVGETPADFVKRHRLERALAMMAHARRPSLTSIALDCGFASPSDFSRSFRQRYGAAPSKFDLAAWREAHRANYDPSASEPAPQARLRQLPLAHNPDGFRVAIRDLPARTVAYIRVSNPYQPDAVPHAVERLVAWAERHGLAGGQWLGYQWENPELVALEDCQYHVAVEAERFTASGEIGRFRFKPMTVAQVEIFGGIDLEIRALHWIYGVWLPRSGYVPDDQPGFEAWIGRPFAHGMEKFHLHVQLPVRRG